MTTSRAIFFFAILILLTSCSSEEHLVFMSVPINGHVEKFAKDLTKLGFADQQLTPENQIKLTGVFLERNCEIYVYGTRKSETVYKVKVNLPQVIPDSIQNNFEKIQKLLSAEYGNGETRYQQYKSPARFLFNEPRLKRQIREGDLTRYIRASGEITLEVEHGYLSITYLDNLNNELRKREIEMGNAKEIKNK